MRNFWLDRKNARQIPEIPPICFPMIDIGPIVVDPSFVIPPVIHMGLSSMTATPPGVPPQINWLPAPELSDLSVVITIRGPIYQEGL